MVPPRAMMPSVSITSSGRNLFSTRPRHPSRKPRQLPPALAILQTTARMTAFNPGQSPPPVKMPTLWDIPRSPRNDERGTTNDERIAVHRSSIRVRRSPLLPVSLNKCCIDLAFDESRMAEDFAMERYCRFDAFDDELAQGAAHAGDGL